MKKALIDTDILSFFLKGDKAVISSVEEYLKLHQTLTFSEITYYEVLAGLNYKSANRQIENFISFSSKCEILNISRQSVALSAKFYGELRRNGIQIGTSDLLIAGIAVLNEFDLATNNRKHFESISDLNLTKWK